MGVRLILISHAATSAIREVAFPADEPIDQQGQLKASAVITDLRRVDVAWTSPALRAKQTASALQLDATVDPALRDIDLGHWAGRSFADVQQAQPDAISAWISQPDSAPHGGESVTALLARVASWLDALKSHDGRVVAVTHPAVIRAAIVQAIDARPLAFWRIDIAPLCRVSLKGNLNNWTLRSIKP